MALSLRRPTSRGDEDTVALLSSHKQSLVLSSPQEDTIGRDLRESFSELAREQLNIQRLFSTVSTRLEHTERIGVRHPLYREWDDLRERHRKLHRASQINAGQCANYLSMFSNVLLPISTANTDIEEKKRVIEKVLETIPVHQEKARLTSAQFNDLVHDVEAFPGKVSAYLARAESEETSGFWSSLWAGIKYICTQFWRALQKIFEDIVNAFLYMFNRIQRIQCSFAGFFVTVDMFDAPSPSRLASDRAAQQQPRIRRECDAMAHGLGMFEDSWHLVSMACSMLLDKVAFAGKLTSIPLACDATLRTVERVYHPLLESLQAYSVGRSPKA